MKKKPILYEKINQSDEKKKKNIFIDLELKPSGVNGSCCMCAIKGISNWKRREIK